MTRWFKYNATNKDIMAQHNKIESHYFQSKPCNNCFVYWLHLVQFAYSFSDLFNDMIASILTIKQWKSSIVKKGWIINKEIIEKNFMMNNGSGGEKSRAINCRTVCVCVGGGGDWKVIGSIKKISKNKSSCLVILGSGSSQEPFNTPSFRYFH